MAVQLRMMGDPDEIRALLALVNQVAEVATNAREYPNRGGLGVRVYAEVRPLQVDPLQARAERVDGPPTLPTGSPKRSLRRS